MSGGPGLTAIMSVGRKKKKDVLNEKLTLFDLLPILALVVVQFSGLFFNFLVALYPWKAQKGAKWTDGLDGLLTSSQRSNILTPSLIASTTALRATVAMLPAALNLSRVAAINESKDGQFTGKYNEAQRDAQTWQSHVCCGCLRCLCCRHLFLFWT
jgi:hypothetical protein